jgi:class 3 adenylate cyclase/CHASE2 domain-containing sensor protein
MATGAANRKLSKVARPLAVGLCLTLAVTLAQVWGLLGPLQGFMYDRRAELFQYFDPPPVDSLVHLHIDDRAIDVIGGWPWPRSNLARIIDELSLAEPRAIAFDFIFIEAQSHKAIGEENRILTLTGRDEDQAFADAIKRAGNVILPVRFEVHPADVAREKTVLALMNDLDLSAETLQERLAAGGDFDAASWVERTNSNYWGAFDDAVLRRIDAVLESGKSPASIAEWGRVLLPKEDRAYSSTEKLRRIERLVLKGQATRLTYRFTKPSGEAGDAVMLADDINPPILPLAREIADTGFVNAFTDNGVLRSQPLVINYHGRLYPQMGLTLALRMLGVPWENVKVEAGRILIPVQGRTIVVPTRRQWSGGFSQQVGTIMDIPWFGTPHQWQTMYQKPAQMDRQGRSKALGTQTGTGSAASQPSTQPALTPSTQPGAQGGPISLADMSMAGRTARREPVDAQKSITKIWDIVTLQETQKKNLKELDAVLPGLLVMVDRDALEAYTSKKFAPDDVDGRLVFAKNAMAAADDSMFRKYADMDDKQLAAETDDPNELHQLKAFRAAYRGVPALKRELETSQKTIRDARDAVRIMMRGKAVVIGWVATGALADTVKTSIHATMPGVIAHGVIYNGIMRGEMWRPAPYWLDVAVTVALGVLMTVLVVYLHPVQGFACMFGLLGSYTAINGLMVFDYGNVILELAGPLVAVLIVWAFATFVKVLEERKERARITARFRSYVDPSLVQYVIDHPDELVLAGQKREMTVVFTDLAGFTTISEILQEKTVEILNEYIDLVVPIIKEQNGLVNKFLGDGVMFFYGAPEVNQEHALCAVKTVLKLQEALVVFNEGLKKRGLPTVKMRAGVASGPMIVGDAGGRGRSDYTVLGDTVNTSARLESANKATGSLMMVNRRVVELVPEGMFLFRPMARLTVVGKSKPVMVYEPMAYMEKANLAQLKYVEATTLMVEAFIKGEFAQCIKHVEALERLAGGDKLSNSYRTLSEKYLNEGLPLGFDGQIVLAEK